MGVGGQSHAPAALPPRMTRYLLYRRLGGTPGPVWSGAKILPLPEFDHNALEVLLNFIRFFSPPVSAMKIRSMLRKTLLPSLNCGVCIRSESSGENFPRCIQVDVHVSVNRSTYICK